MTYNPDESGMTDEQKALNHLEYEIGREDLDYVDNIRVAREGDRKAIKQYIKQVREGCCGSFDTKVTIDGHEWLIGCNYGH